MIAEKEKKVMELIDDHFEKVGECLDCFKRCLEAFFQADTPRFEAIHANCDHAETEADILQRKIGDYLYSGAFLPIDRKDIYMMTEFVDKIANKAEAASDVLVFQQPHLPEDYKDGLLDIVETVAKMLRILREAVRLFALKETLQADNNLDAIREKIIPIGVMESEVDKQEEALMRSIFASDLPLANKIQLETFLRSITDISDVIEDAADRLYILVIRERI
jgi:predicted phosphate transport protein (TIGR00153 family)